MKRANTILAIILFAMAGCGGNNQSMDAFITIEDIILDEDNNEMFVKDYQARKIWVYDLYGNFKRSFKFADTGYYNFAFNYDRDHLICYKSYLPIDNEQSGHVLISKQDGSITREIHVPVKKIPGRGFGLRQAGKTPIQIYPVQ
ncbi:MAG: 6-bladed beta-propeller [Tannerellaceae bacterium]|nr:6-bladed beta-propeller [Tannerellaceae bacterium]